MLLVGLLAAGLVGCSSSRSAQSEKNDPSTINTGYGVQQEETVTSATSTLEPDEQDQDTATHFSDLLRGRTAGVQVHQTPNGVRVTIRGVSTINGNRHPLYVIDGMRVEPNFDGTVPVHPRDVKSITVLKDAAATSIYGARGGNGVIVIDTKDR
jgi:TonB-dependent SusC/RagA subfamily outer membrane receptor